MALHPTSPPLENPRKGTRVPQRPPLPLTRPLPWTAATCVGRPQAPGTQKRWGTQTGNHSGAASHPAGVSILWVTKFFN